MSDTVEELKKKVCKICNSNKPISEYNKAGGGKWLQPYCKPCDSERKKEYAKNNVDKLKLSRQRYYTNNIEDIKERRKKEYIENRAAILAYHKEYGEKNKDIISAKGKEYRKKNSDYVRQRDKQARINALPRRIEKEREYRAKRTPEQKERDSIKKKEWAIKNKDRLKVLADARKDIKREQRRIWCNNKSATDIGFRVLKNLRGRTRFALKRDGAVKLDTTEKLLGCTISFFKEYFSSLFYGEMTWGNFMNGEVHIDHIKPCVKFDLTKEDEQMACFNYKNLQPLWWYDNLKKSDNYEEQKVA